jgi:hypothetical protein
MRCSVRSNWRVAGKEVEGLRASGVQTSPVKVSFAQVEDREDAKVEDRDDRMADQEVSR